MLLLNNILSQLKLSFVCVHACLLDVFRKAHIKIWNGDTLQTEHELGKDKSMGETICCVAFSSFEPDLLASVHVDRIGEHELTIWNWRIGKVLARAQVQDLKNESILKCNK